MSREDFSVIQQADSYGHILDQIEFTKLMDLIAFTMCETAKYWNVIGLLVRFKITFLVIQHV